MIDSCSIFQITGNENLTNSEASDEIFDFLLRSLQEQGIKTFKKRTRTYYRQVQCKYDNTRLNIIIFNCIKSAEKRMALLKCERYIPLWKYFLKIHTQEDLCEGIPLQKLVDSIDLILKTDSRYVGIRWLKFSDWSDEFFSKVGYDYLSGKCD